MSYIIKNGKHVKIEDGNKKLEVFTDGQPEEEKT